MKIIITEDQLKTTVFQKTVDMAFDEQQVIDHAFGIYEQFCYKKDQISFKKFYDAYASMNDALMTLIR